MTLLGKVMVFFVLLFSLITGGLIVKVYLTRTNWKAGYDDAVNQGTVLQASIRADREATRKALELRDADLDKQRAEIKRLQTEAGGLKSQIAELERQRSERETKAVSEQTNQENATRQVEQLKTERNQDKQLISQKDSTIVKLNKDIVDFRNRAVQAEIERNAFADKNQNLMLLAQNQARKLSQYEQQGVSLPNPNKRPPAVEVKGTVEEVAGSHAQISLGRDHGLAKDDELQVYRLSPEPKYLGTLRLTNLEDHRSVGIFSPATRNANIMKGDTVDTRVMPR
jgi:hypothetical protein